MASHLDPLMLTLLYWARRVLQFKSAILFEVMLGVSMWTSVPFILLFTAIYAASGGLRAVMYTDVGQATIFIIGGFIGMIVAFSKIGGFAGLAETMEKNDLGYMLTTLRPPSDREFPWTGMLIGQPLASMWYWCVDQTMVQRVLSAKGVQDARKGCVLAGYLKILPPFLMVFPGLIARAFFAECQRTDGQLYSDWCGTDLGDGNESSKAYPLLIAKMFPDGLRGLLIVSMVLAMMSSLDSVFNCLSTVFSYDIYKRFLHPEASRQRQVWVGQLVTGVAALCGLAWLPMIASSANGLYLTTQSAQTHMSPTLVAVFLVGLFWPRANGAGALAGMIVGFAAGIARFVASRMATCDEHDTYSISCMQFNHMALILFAAP
ncbi:Slc5a3 [Symbiodinium natans]|uniref:Slc5a3 protein n=1 Tax=Symbiodinium natans TaxID=878477 RepID=A0A812L7N9_9DINO|nr:Slc5a3 [Symbiodinium natans]